MLPVVRNPPESMQMPLGLSLRMDIITSAVTEPDAKDKKTGGVSVVETIPETPGQDDPHRRVAAEALCLPCSAAWPAPSWPEDSRG